MANDQPNTTRARRVAALRAAGITQAELAARLGVSRQSVGLVLADHHRSRRVEQGIADACGIAVDDLFPASAPETRREPPDSEKTAGGHGVARDTRPQPVVASRVDDPHLESVLIAELRAVADQVLIAVAAGDLAADRTIVRAAAAAVRALAG